MTSKNSIFIRVPAVVILAITLNGNALALDKPPHLLPISPNFDTLAPYGKQYANLCEKLLFPAPAWLVRYFQVIGDPPYDTGVTVYEKPNGTYRLMLKQSKPAIGDIVMNASFGRLDLQSSIASMKIKTSDREIPNDVAVELHKLWLAFVMRARSPGNIDKRYYIHPAKVILWAKNNRHTVLSGKYPPDAAEHEIFTSLETIVDDLVKTSDVNREERQQLLARIAKNAHRLRTRLEKRVRGG
jgi:hypothetical protein